MVYKRRTTRSIEQAQGLLSGTEEARGQIERELACAAARYEGLAPACYLAYDREALYERGNRDLRLTFDDYTTPELARIFRRFARLHGFELEDGVSQEVSTCMDALRGKRDFANARTVRRLYDRTVMECAMRCDQARIAPVDVRRAFAQPDISGDANQRHVGFC